jgi:sec-independent protein translocase protein TatC
VFLNVKFFVEVLQTPVSNVKFFQLAPGEYFLCTIKISFYLGLLFSVPYVLSQILLFLIPGLNVSERKVTLFLFSSSFLLFSVGLLFAYYILVPAALKFFLSYGSEIIEPLLSFEQYFGFISVLFFYVGLVFQLPILQVILSAVKFVSGKQMLSNLSYVVLFSTIVGAVLTPSADPLTQLLLAAAIVFLYIVGALLAILLQS